MTTGSAIEVLTAKQAAKRAGITEKGIYSWVYRGEITPAFTAQRGSGIGNRLFFSPEDVDRTSDRIKKNKSAQARENIKKAHASPNWSGNRAATKAAEPAAPHACASTPHGELFAKRLGDQTERIEAFVANRGDRQADRLAEGQEVIKRHAERIAQETSLAADERSRERASILLRRLDSVDRAATDGRGRLAQRLAKVEKKLDRVLALIDHPAKPNRPGNGSQTSRLEGGR